MADAGTSILLPYKLNANQKLKTKLTFTHEDVIAGSNTIQYLLIHEIGIQNITIKPEFWEHLTKLNLSNNKLSKVPNLLKLKNLIHLNVSSNIIDVFPANIPNSLVHLNLRNNQLGAAATSYTCGTVYIRRSCESFKLQAQSALKYLNINRNSLQHIIIDAQYFPHLQFFHFAKNPLIDYPHNFHELKELRNLEVTYQNIKAFHTLKEIFNVPDNFKSLRFIYVGCDYCYYNTDQDHRCDSDDTACIPKPDISRFPNLKIMKWGWPTIGN